ncbi:hypothetical protein ACJX0J_041078, partial [Zea mays]
IYVMSQIIQENGKTALILMLARRKTWLHTYSIIYNLIHVWGVCRQHNNKDRAGHEPHLNNRTPVWNSSNETTLNKKLIAAKVTYSALMLSTGVTKKICLKIIPCH